MVETMMMPTSTAASLASSKRSKGTRSTAASTQSSQSHYYHDDSIAGHREVSKWKGKVSDKKKKLKKEKKIKLAKKKSSKKKRREKATTLPSTTIKLETPPEVMAHIEKIFHQAMHLYNANRAESFESLEVHEVWLCLRGKKGKKKTKKKKKKLKKERPQDEVTVSNNAVTKYLKATSKKKQKDAIKKQKTKKPTSFKKKPASLKSINLDTIDEAPQESPTSSELKSVQNGEELTDSLSRLLHLEDLFARTNSLDESTRRNKPKVETNEETRSIGPPVRPRDPPAKRKDKKEKKKSKRSKLKMVVKKTKKLARAISGTSKKKKKSKKKDLDHDSSEVMNAAQDSFKAQEGYDWADINTAEGGMISPLPSPQKSLRPSLSNWGVGDEDREHSETSEYGMTTMSAVMDAFPQKPASFQSCSDDDNSLYLQQEVGLAPTSDDSSSSSYVEEILNDSDEEGSHATSSSASYFEEVIEASSQSSSAEEFSSDSSYESG